ncbi:DUF3604 domain-containing protein [bacterium]|nr:DUF3604 domain-containing protein [bacterium]
MPNHDRGFRWPAVAAALVALTAGCGNGDDLSAGNPVIPAADRAFIAARAGRQAPIVERVRSGRGEAAPPPDTLPILFGDLHVHSTYSMDAFFMSLPMMGGDKAHPVSDACDFARYCSDLDFFSINDHAENITLPLWRETRRAIRACNQYPDGEEPDVIAYLGWEWSHVAPSPNAHYGHKNVILRDLDDDKVPARPINAQSPDTARAMATKTPLSDVVRLLAADPANVPYLLDLVGLQTAVAETPVCASDVNTRKLPDDCMETATTPAELFRKLDEWQMESIVIPHGTTWGLYTPPGASIDKQLAPGMHDPDRQILFEVYSGHGNSEEHRPWRAVEFDGDGTPICPAATRDFEPCCRRAGEIIRSRCADPASAECQVNVDEAMRIFLSAGAGGIHTVPGATVADWKDCDQCRDCFNAAFSYRPGGAAQRALVLGGFDNEGEPGRFRFGFIASSDTHTARAGNGYKDIDRQEMTDAVGPTSARVANVVRRPRRERPYAMSLSDAEDELLSAISLPLWDFERSSSFFMTGGLVAVHGATRERDSIWEALKRREVYGTSGPKILLWFDHIAPGGERAPMGSIVESGTTPRFIVHAAGSFKQNPGCPERTLRALGAERTERVCRGECDFPSDERRLITRIEVIRIRPQVLPDEPIEDLIEDPWRVYECPPSPEGCSATFDDPEYATLGRETVYYVRAIEEPSPAINAAGVRCEYDESGACVKADPCYGDFRTPFDDNCAVMNEERAWSSPIYLLPRIR